MEPTLEPPRAPSILLIGADEWLARSIESLLAGEGHTVVREHALRDALAGLRRHMPDAVVLSLDLRHPDAPALCKSLREDVHLSPATPVFVTAPAAPTRQERLAALRAGATEVMTQPLDTEEFLLRLTGHLRIKHDMDLARESRMFDPATGLYSPLGLSQRQQELTAHAARTSAALACVVIAVRPTSGAGVPDDIGRTLHRMSRRSDVLGQLGTAEFAVLALDTSSEAAALMADRLARGLQGSVGGSGVRTGRAAAVGDRQRWETNPPDLLAAAKAALSDAVAP